MARTVKPEEYASKRNEILDVALRMMLTRGFAQVSIQDILKEIKISSGAFHHYFESRDDLLEGIILRILEASVKQILPTVQDPNLTAIQKLQGFFGTLDQLRIEHKADVVRLEKIWYGDENALVRQRMNEAVIEQRAPLLNEIVRQGIREGVFTVAHPELSGEIILALLQGMGDTHARLLMRGANEADDCVDETAEQIVETHAAYMDAVEQVLGAPANSLYRADRPAVMLWVTAIRADK